MFCVIIANGLWIGSYLYMERLFVKQVCFDSCGMYAICILIQLCFGMKLKHAIPWKTIENIRNMYDVRICCGKTAYCEGMLCLSIQSSTWTPERQHVLWHAHRLPSFINKIIENCTWTLYLLGEQRAKSSYRIDIIDEHGMPHMKHDPIYILNELYEYTAICEMCNVK